MSTDDRGLKACFLAARLEETWIKEFQDSLGGPIFLGLFFFAFPWFFLRKQQFPYVLDGFGVIFLGFPTKKHVFAFPWLFLGKTAVSLCFGRIWRDFPWFSYEKTYSCP